MASPALAVLAALASRRSRFFFRARAFLPYIALDEWIFLYACRARVVVRRGFRESVYSNEEDWTWTPPGQKRTKFRKKCTSKGTPRQPLHHATRAFPLMETCTTRFRPLTRFASSRRRTRYSRPTVPRRG
jgi:hypothetical protein